METFKTIFATIWAYPGIKVIVILTLLNLVTALAVAIRTKKFTFQALGDFLFTQLLPYVIVYGGFQFVVGETGFEWVSALVLTTIITMLSARILSNLSMLGLPLPGSIAAVVSPRV